MGPSVRRPHLHLFQVEAGSGKISYYVWNAIASSIFRIDALRIDEMRATMNGMGKGKGRLAELSLVDLDEE